jgi:hypothetical protein
MIDFRWFAGGTILGMLISTVMIPPTRKEAKLPRPHDPSVYSTDSGCVRFESVEVPCGQEPESLNLLASLTKK